MTKTELLMLEALKALLYASNKDDELSDRIRQHIKDNYIPGDTEYTLSAYRNLANAQRTLIIALVGELRKHNIQTEIDLDKLEELLCHVWQT